MLVNFPLDAIKEYERFEWSWVISRWVSECLWPGDEPAGNFQLGCQSTFHIPSDQQPHLLTPWSSSGLTLRTRQTGTLWQMVYHFNYITINTKKVYQCSRSSLEEPRLCSGLIFVFCTLLLHWFNHLCIPLWLRAGEVFTLAQIWFVTEIIKSASPNRRRADICESHMSPVGSCGADHRSKMHFLAQYKRIVSRYLVTLSKRLSETWVSGWKKQADLFIQMVGYSPVSSAPH